MTLSRFNKHLAEEVGVILAVMSGIGAVTLAIFIKLYPNDLLDLLVSREVQEGATSRLLALMNFVSLFGGPYVALLVTSIVIVSFLAFGRVREALFVALTPLAAVFNSVLKIVIDRPRPAASLVIVYQQLTDPSFPSGHVVYYVVFFGFLITTMFSVREIPALVRVATVAVSATLIALVSVSRIYLGVHWASDVLEGYFVGYLFLFVLSYWYLKNVPDAIREPAV